MHVGSRADSGNSGGSSNLKVLHAARVLEQREQVQVGVLAKSGLLRQLVK